MTLITNEKDYYSKKEILLEENLTKCIKHTLTKILNEHSEEHKSELFGRNNRLIIVLLSEVDWADPFYIELYEDADPTLNFVDTYRRCIPGNIWNTFNERNRKHRTLLKEKAKIDSSFQ